MILRDEQKARERLLADCKRPAFARLATYTKPTDDGSGDTFTRASVKFVEAALARWGNVRTQCITISDTKDTRIVRVVVTDLEGGAEYSKELLLEKIVEKKKCSAKDVVLGQRNTPDGNMLLVRATEDDLNSKEAQLSSVVVRQLGLRILPADLVEECMDVVAMTVAETPSDLQRIVGKIAFTMAGELAKDGAVVAAAINATQRNVTGQGVHPKESRSSALADALAKRKAPAVAKVPATPQAGAVARQTVPCECGLLIYQQGKQWLHTNGSRKCGAGRAIAKPRKATP